MSDPRDLIQRLADALHQHTCLYEGYEDTLVTEARAFLEKTYPVTVEKQRPDRLVVGDIWEFETELRVKGKRKPQTVTVQAEVKGYHFGECAWQLQSLDGDHYFYLLQYAPQYEEMTYIGNRFG